MEEQPPVLVDQPAQTQSQVSLGATFLGEGRCRFLVWAPKSSSVDVLVLQPHPQRAPMQKKERGYFETVLENVPRGSLYRYVLEGGKERPDPASRFQPKGVHGPSQVEPSQEFSWTNAHWKGIPLAEYILYELHPGTFTPAGTFEAIIPRLDDLKTLGITALEVMPVAQFPGGRNWGYDGVFPFAVQNTYGGPEGLKRLADACHSRGLAIVLDVVYNHFGPEGNYTGDFGPYVTDQYRTPWGQAINFDGPGSDEVVRFFTENALYWLTEFHIDALRLDAIHSIMDRNARPFLAMLALQVQEFRRQTGRDVYLIAESDLNDTRVVRSRETGGYGLDAQWSDDFHHALHALLTKERSGYYQDFGELGDVVKALQEGFVYSGQYSTYRRRRHGNSSRNIPSGRFVVFGQNHDQVGNRMMSERLSRLISFDGLKLIAGVVMLSPFIPLLFMGEEYGEEAPFNFFTSHGDAPLIEAVRKGRRNEFAAFGWQSESPDPQAEETFLASKLRCELGHEGSHGVLMDFYRELIRLRKAWRPMSVLSKESMEVRRLERQKAIFLRRWHEDAEVFAAFSFNEVKTACRLPAPPGQWRKLLDSSEARWLGEGGEAPPLIESAGFVSLELRPHSFILFGKEASRSQD
ncbi:MAG: malto-oligosyltrehalose trehalohydrolase [Terriglobia bacterium]